MSPYCAVLNDPTSAGETTGKLIPLRPILYATGITGSPVKERLPNMPVKCNLVGATTIRGGGGRTRLSQEFAHALDVEGVIEDQICLRPV